MAEQNISIKWEKRYRYKETDKDEIIKIKWENANETWKKNGKTEGFLTFIFAFLGFFSEFGGEFVMIITLTHFRQCLDISPHRYGV